MLSKCPTHDRRRRHGDAAADDAGTAAAAHRDAPAAAAASSASVAHFATAATTTNSPMLRCEQRALLAEVAADLAHEEQHRAVRLQRLWHAQRQARDSVRHRRVRL